MLVRVVRVIVGSLPQSIVEGEEYRHLARMASCSQVPLTRNGGASLAQSSSDSGSAKSRGFALYEKICESLIRKHLLITTLSADERRFVFQQRHCCEKLLTLLNLLHSQTLNELDEFNQR